LSVSCIKKEAADIIVLNANIYTVDEAFNKAEALVVKDGRFLDVGTSKDIQQKIRR